MPQKIIIEEKELVPLFALIYFTSLKFNNIIFCHNVNLDKKEDIFLQYFSSCQKC